MSPRAWLARSRNPLRSSRVRPRASRKLGRRRRGRGTATSPTRRRGRRGRVSRVAAQPSFASASASRQPVVLALIGTSPSSAPTGHPTSRADRYPNRLTAASVMSSSRPPTNGPLSRTRSRWQRLRWQTRSQVPQGGFGGLRRALRGKAGRRRPGGCRTGRGRSSRLARSAWGRRRRRGCAGDDHQGDSQQGEREDKRLVSAHCGFSTGETFGLAGLVGTNRAAARSRPSRSLMRPVTLPNLPQVSDA